MTETFKQNTDNSEQQLLSKRIIELLKLQLEILTEESLAKNIHKEKWLVNSQQTQAHDMNNDDIYIEDWIEKYL